MKTLRNLSALLAIFVLANPVISCQSNSEILKSVTTIQKYEVIIDNRTQEEFDAGHIKGAILIPYTEIEQKIAEAVPDKSTSIGVYCRSGRRSGIARNAMLKLGYKNVVNIGGMEEAAKKVGLPIVK